MTEQDLQTKLIEFLHAKGCYVVKVISASKRGVPDLIACHRGFFIGIECKAPDKPAEPDKLQEYNFERIAEAGGFCLCVNSVNGLSSKWIEIERMIGFAKLRPVGRRV